MVKLWGKRVWKGYQEWLYHWISKFSNYHEIVPAVAIATSVRHLQWDDYGTGYCQTTDVKCWQLINKKIWKVAMDSIGNLIWMVWRYHWANNRYWFHDHKKVKEYFRLRVLNFLKHNQGNHYRIFSTKSAARGGSLHYKSICRIA